MSDEKEHAFAVVESVEEEGLRLKFDGEDAAGEKAYKCNTFFVFAPGDRVYCVRDSGTYVAICKIGTPVTELSVAKAKKAESAENATNAKNAESAKKAETATSAESATSATSATNATNATNATIAEKVKAVQYSYENNSVQFRWNSNGYVEFKHDKMDAWMPLLAPRDEARTSFGINTAEKVIRFRSTGSGKLEFCIPYWSSTTWYTVATT